MENNREDELKMIKCTNVHRSNEFTTNIHRFQGRKRMKKSPEYHAAALRLVR